MLQDNSLTGHGKCTEEEINQECRVLFLMQTVVLFKDKVRLEDSWQMLVIANCKRFRTKSNNWQQERKHFVSDYPKILHVKC